MQKNGKKRTKNQKIFDNAIFANWNRPRTISKENGKKIIKKSKTCIYKICTPLVMESLLLLIICQEEKSSENMEMGRDSRGKMYIQRLILSYNVCINHA